jgi:hypothetical protein
MKDILYWFIEDQNPSDMPRSAQMSFVLNEPK